MKLSFYKYQGTGNDFVMIDNRTNLLSKNDTKLIRRLCDRKFGIGADGLILLEKPEDDSLDFTMVYFNSDGRESSMCGNGGRCIIAFAHFLGIGKGTYSFNAIDGLHEGIIAEGGQVGLKMGEVEKIAIQEEYLFLDTGSPHHIIFKEDIDSIDVKKEGAEVRFSELYKNSGGSNINFVEQVNTSTLKIRTYERGVEDETLSCGTGATAAALASFALGKTTSPDIKLQTLGGELQVKFEASENGYRNIWLFGPATQVFEGKISC